MQFLNENEKADAEQEVEIIKGLKHECIVSFYESFQRRQPNAAADICMVTEYCADGDLRKYTVHHVLSDAQRVRWLAQLLLALDYLHKKSIVHRDIKPENILLSG